jgi:hypothetical protein
MSKQSPRRSAILPIEPLENRTLLSSTLHAAIVPDAKATAPATSTKLAVHSGELGQAVKFTVTEHSSGTGGAPIGSVALTVDGSAFQTLTLSSKSARVKTIKATYTVPAGAGGTPFFFGTHTVTADFASTGSLPASSASGSFTVNEPKFKLQSDGLGIATIANGHGAAIRQGETASMLYTGYLAADGTIFDYSDAHGGTPFTFQVEDNPEQVITGFDEGTVGMKIGTTRVLMIPSALGYGTEGSAPSIPANADLVFLITLEGIS